jgi:hypothetical protein
MNMPECDQCKQQHRCRETAYVWLKHERAHGIDRSKCKPRLSLWTYIVRLFNRLATWWRWGR